MNKIFKNIVHPVSANSEGEIRGAQPPRTSGLSIKSPAKMRDLDGRHSVFDGTDFISAPISVSELDSKLAIRLWHSRSDCNKLRS
jgi:hypothetical protein